MTYDTINDAVTIAGGAEGALLANRYRVVRQLGQGGMGSVWLAEDTQLDNKLFAIKMLPSILVSNKRAYRQLKDEALVAMRLVHPNIVQLRAFEENGGNPFLVMDYINGETLDDYLSEKGKLSEAETIRLLRPIAAALDYAHAKGVVHRDVKPGNVMVAKDGTTYMLDFGIAREMQETLTRVTGKLSSGTLLYMSPEQLNGAAPKKEQDIYSFAAMAYECLNGEPPFTRGDIGFQIINNPPPQLEGHGTFAPSLVSGIMSGLAKDSATRPSFCMAVLGCDEVEPRASIARNDQVSSPMPIEMRDHSQSVKSWRPDKLIAVLAFLAALACGLWLIKSRDNGIACEQFNNPPGTNDFHVVTNIVSSGTNDICVVTNSVPDSTTPPRTFNGEDVWKNLVCALMTNNCIEVPKEKKVTIGDVKQCASSRIEETTLNLIKENFRKGCTEAIKSIGISVDNNESNPVLSGELNDGGIKVIYADGKVEVTKTNTNVVEKLFKKLKGDRP